MKALDLRPEQSTGVVQGFGNVGSVACQELHRRGVRIIAVGDRYGAIRNDRGIDIPALNLHVSSGKLLRDFPDAQKIDPEELLAVPCTVLVPAAMERVVHGGNASKLRCRILAEGANGPTTIEADRILSSSDIFVIPDVLCNAGGVTVSYFEWVQDIQQLMWSETQVNEKLAELMRRAFHQVNDLSRARKISMRTAALSMGVQKVAREKMIRGLYP
ncbi:MAG: Glu/Leu/Phe/Val family dehydrogenase [Gemmataceae bacterium]